MSYKKIRIVSAAVAALTAFALFAEREATLGEGWRFLKDPSGSADWSAEDHNDSSWERVRVPHDWAISGPFDMKEPTGITGRLPWKGTGWYRLRFDLTEKDLEGCVFLDFDGVMASPEVYVNGSKAGGWDYGYASFRVDATRFARPGRNVLAVRASTKDHSARWYPGAGIYRRVVLKTRGKAHFAYDGVFVSTPAVSRKHATVKVAWETEGAPAGAMVRVSLRSGDVRVASSVAKEIQGAVLIEVESPRLWDVDDPALYFADVELTDGSGVVLSRETIRFGIRSIEFPVPEDRNDWASNGFHLNGRRVQFYGVNNHSDLGLLGMAFDKSAARRQLRIMKDMGCNSLRMSHNPPAPELLDLCDEMGILVWDEAFDKWDSYGGKREDQSLEEYVARNLGAFVRRDRNHPCVIIWSIANEIWEWDPAHPIRNKENVFADRGPSGQTRVRNTFFRDQVRLHDTTRPVGNGNRPYMNEKRILDLGIFDPLDLTGWNYYRSYVPVKDRYPSMPIIYTESGSAVSSTGYYSEDPLTGRRGWRRGKGAVTQVDSRDLHSSLDIVDEVFDYMDTDVYCCGEFVWTGFDYLGEPIPFSKEARSSYFGIVDLTGVPKDRFWLYRSHWNRKERTLHISPDTWTFPGREGRKTPVMVYTDCDEAELFLNGRSLGRRKKGVPVALPPAMTNHHFAACHKYRLMWLDVPYEPGTLEAVSYAEGAPVMRKMLRTAGKPAALELQLEPLAGEDADELLWIHAVAVDGAGIRTVGATDRIEFSLEGPGEILGTGNADACEYVPFTDPSGHSLFAGRATTVIRRTGKGTLSVKVTSPTLKGAVLQVP